MKKLNESLRTVRNYITLVGIFSTSGMLGQQNGLNNTVSAPNIELGGNLIRPTNVTLDNTTNQYNLAFNGEGQFGVGNILNASSSFGTSKAIFAYDNNSGSTGFSPLYNTIYA